MLATRKEVGQLLGQSERTIRRMMADPASGLCRHVRLDRNPGRVACQDSKADVRIDLEDVAAYILWRRRESTWDLSHAEPPGHEAVLALAAQLSTEVLLMREIESVFAGRGKSLRKALERRLASPFPSDAQLETT